jgi:hypothetical protein
MDCPDHSARNHGSATVSRVVLETDYPNVNTDNETNKRLRDALYRAQVTQTSLHCNLHDSDGRIIMLLSGASNHAVIMLLSGASNHAAIWSE